MIHPASVEPAPAEEIESGRWRDEWVVIAVEEPDGKPIYLDTTAENYPVFLARREPEGWHHVQVANSLAGFLAALARVSVQYVGEKEGTFRNRLLPDQADDQLLAAILKDNPHAEVWFWRRMFPD